MCIAAGTVAVLLAVEFNAAVGITGELAGDGSLLAVDAPLEKLLGANRFGVEDVIFPADNTKDGQLVAPGADGTFVPVLVPRKAAEQIKVHRAAHFLEVLAMVLHKSGERQES